MQFMSFRRGSRGFSLLQMIVYVAITALIAVAGVRYVPDMIERAREESLGSLGDQLNVSTIQFLATGGEILPTMEAPQVLGLLQTPVDATSRRAGFGTHPLIDHTVTLQAAGESGPRLIFKYDPALKRPVWSVAHEGAGYVAAYDKTREIPAVADWTGRVDRAGQTAARKSKWVWDYDETKTFGPGGDGSSVSDGPGGFNPPGAVGPELWIEGPFRITTPGTYYWTGNATQAGSLSINVAGDVRSAISSTQVQSVARSFNPGESGSFVVTLSRTEGGTQSKTVEYSVGFEPELIIVGPDVVSVETMPDSNVLAGRFVVPAGSWKAVSNSGTRILQIRIDSEPSIDAKFSGTEGGKISVESREVSFLPGPTREITIVASAMNASGIVHLTKKVSVELTPPDAEWVLPAGMVAGDAINNRDPLTFVFVGKVGAPGFLEITGSFNGSSVYSNPAVGLPSPISDAISGASKLPVVVDFSSLAGDVRYSGELLLTGKFTTKLGSVTKTLTVPLNVLRTHAWFTWVATAKSEVTLLDYAPEDIEKFELVLKRNGSIVETFSGPSGVNKFEIPAQYLPVGEYELVGTAYSKANGAGSPASTTVTVAP